ncbi:PhaM family polyhydroxyalkanoate granule multifunctional regulatory protein [Cupriavidus sp. MP-37]|uniref:PhaM family polyhydroxyalkanoate granule multifunctional regulatory protein n=1 Tax=Cupriavidus sp. MP-37 TaxID=2884455 RepID=UPI001D0B6285|nr:PhaM family polyhydroxyalkanoate granule multifunctional regulatory protein [Cupriavidus sp. MP-37]UDM50303.1 hypothetical protein LIN44_00485 [Cupriavidus sp. MP-37]
MFGQIPDFTNGFDFMRRLWGGAGMPASLMPGLQAMTPPMDLEDLDKRIADLKAVESWLQLNTNLLRTTIQGLEVQRATLVALQTFGNALSPEAMQSAMDNVARAANAPSAEAPQRTGADTGSGKPAEPPAAEPAQPAQPAAGDAEAARAPNAALWWDMLQQQFNQIASSAAAASMVPFGMGGMGGFGAAGAATPAGAAPSGAGKPKTAAAGEPPSSGASRPAAKKAPAKKAAARKSAKAKPARHAGEGGDGGNGSNNGAGGSVTN